MASDVEIIDFTRPDSSRKNLFITNIPGSLNEDDIVVELRQIFERYGLVYGVLVYPTQWKPKHDAEHVTEELSCGFYAFVTFYSCVAATRAKDNLKGVLMLADNECKMFEDTENMEQTAQAQTASVKYVCLIELKVMDLKTDGIGVWQESYTKPDPMSRIQATCKCKKVCQHHAVQNAFSKVLLIVLGNGKVTVEIDTTMPEFRSEVLPEDQLIKVNELDDLPESEAMSENVTDSIDISSKITDGDMDDINLHILQELEDDM